MATRRRKGIVYSLITLLLVVPILLFLISYQEAAGSLDEVAALKIRGIEISNFADSVDQDVPRIFRITATRAIISAINEIDINGTALNNSQLQLIELMYNASIYNRSSQFMNASSLRDWADRMKQQGSRFGLNTNLTFVYLNVTPYDSFNLEFSMLLSVNATDADGIVSIYRTYNQSFVMPLEGLEDPLYMLSTNGFVKRTIQKANLTVYGSWAVDQTITSERYMATDDGPSFLDRMEGRTTNQEKYSGMSPEVIGLESFVNLQQISQVGIPVRENQSNIDHQYFNESTFTGCMVLNTSYPWFKLDSFHNATYGVPIGTGC